MLSSRPWGKKHGLVPTLSTRAMESWQAPDPLNIPFRKTLIFVKRPARYIAKNRCTEDNFSFLMFHFLIALHDRLNGGPDIDGEFSKTVGVPGSTVQRFVKNIQIAWNL